MNLLTFLNPEINTRHAQLIFTTHDTWQLSNQLLRRDEVWFTEKDEQGISKRYSLTDFVDESGARIRKDESYEKNYLVVTDTEATKRCYFQGLHKELLISVLQWPFMMHNIEYPGLCLTGMK